MSKSARVRIALAIDYNGDWVAYGRFNDDEIDVHHTLGECLCDIAMGHDCYWIEADVPVPSKKSALQGTPVLESKS